ncbi:MAG: DUF2846 domain-containing protein [Terracidiphilus sp.]|jgi:hypothetical protein
MKIALVALLFAASALAQGPRAGLSPACGPAGVQFKVDLESAQPGVLPPEPGQARIYFIHDAGTPALFAYPTTRLGVDGEWVGANHGNSYFSISVDPGEHHLCASLQSSVVDPRAEFAYLTAQAGKTYFYRTRLVMSREVELLELEPIDSDQGRYLIASYPLSAPTPKK